MKRKLTLSILLISIFVIIIQPMVYADSVVEGITGVLTEGWGYFLEDDTHIDIDVELGKTDATIYSKDITERLLRIVQVIGTIISIIALVIIGIRYMVSSVEEQSKIKGVIPYYVMGAVLVFATSNILSIAYKVIRSLE